MRGAGSEGDQLARAMAELSRAVSENTRAQQGGDSEAAAASPETSDGVSKRRKALGKLALAAAAVPLAQGADAFARGGSFTGGVQRSVIDVLGSAPILGSLTGLDISKGANASAQAQLNQFATDAARAGVELSEKDLAPIGNFLLDQGRRGEQNKRAVANFLSSDEAVARSRGSSVEGDAASLVSALRGLTQVVERVETFLQGVVR